MTMTAFIENVPQNVIDRVDELNNQLKGIFSIEGLNNVLREYADITFNHVAAYNRFSNEVKNLNTPENGFNSRLNELIETNPHGREFFDNMREMASNAEQKDLMGDILREHGLPDRPTGVENAARDIYLGENGYRGFREMAIQGRNMAEKGLEQPKSIADSILRSAKDVAKREVIPFKRHDDLSKTLKAAGEKVQADNLSKNTAAPAKDAITRGPVGP